MVVLSSAGTKLMQQNRRFLWGFRKRQGCAQTRYCYTSPHVCVSTFIYSAHAYTQLSLLLTCMHTYETALSNAPCCHICLRAHAKAQTWLLHCHKVHAHMALFRYFLCLFHVQYSRQRRAALSQRDAQQNENGREYCRQTQNNGGWGESGAWRRGPTAVEAE